jgi:hypothetical protein
MTSMRWPQAHSTDAARQRVTPGQSMARIAGRFTFLTTVPELSHAEVHGIWSAELEELLVRIGHRTPAGLQHLLSRACWDPDEVRDGLQE